MVCLEGITLVRLENSLSNADLKKYPLWSWLTHLLTNYIYSLEHEKENPEIPSKNDRSLYALWFNDMIKEFLKEFNDTTPERVYRSLLNPPCKDIAYMVYTATSLELQKGFLASICFYEPSWNSPPPNSKKKMLNPAEDNTVNQSNSDLYDDSDDDSMPDLEPPGLPDDISLPNLEDIKNIPDDLPDLINSIVLPKSTIKFWPTWDALPERVFGGSTKKKTTTTYI